MCSRQKWYRLKDLIVIGLLAQISYLAKSLFLAYSPEFLAQSDYEVLETAISQKKSLVIILCFLMDVDIHKS